jgi:hypothetical protein
VNVESFLQARRSLVAAVLPLVACALANQVGAALATPSHP